MSYNFGWQLWGGGGNGITLYRSTIDSYKNGKLFVNGIAEEGDCFLELSGKQRNGMLICQLYIGISISIFAFIGIAGYLLLKRKEIKLEYVFLITAGIIGILFIVIVPPYAEHDGEAHFNTIYNYSNKLLGYEVSEETRQIKKEEKDIWGNKFGYRARRGEYYSVYQMIKDDSVYGDNVYEVHELSLDLSSFPIEYLFSILGLTIGRILGLKIIYIYYLTRIFNFAAYIILTYWAIKLIPIYKYTLFLIAILPMSLMQAASVSYDAMVMGTIFLFVSLCLYLMQNHIKKTHLVAVALLSGCLIYNKSAAYFPLIGLVLLIPLKKQYGKKQRTLFWIMEMGCVLFAAADSFAGSAASQIGNYSIFYSIEHPLWFIKILGYTIYSNFDLYLKGIFGVSIFGISALDTPFIICIPVIALLLFVYRCENNMAMRHIDNQKRIFILFCVLSSALMIFLGTVSWTEIGSDWLWGIQGRYFIPLLLPAMFWKSRLVTTEKEQGNDVLYYMCTIDGFYVLYVLTTFMNAGI